MALLKNHQWIYTKRPQSVVTNKHYTLKKSTIDASTIKEDEALLQAKYWSVDPYMRIQQSQNNTWEAPHPLDTLQGGAAVCQVLVCNNPKSDIKAGDWVLSYTGWQEYAIAKTSELRKLDPNEVPVTTALGILGMPARIAYFGLIETGIPKEGETVVVSGASGAVGQIVVQIAKIKGCKVIGIAGSDEKLAYLKNVLDVDQVINYQKHPSHQKIKESIKEACPEGIDIYYDNVGGFITDAIFELINHKARIIVCGQISQYSGGLDTPEMGPRFLHHILYKRATIQGVLARDYNDRMDEMLAEMTSWVKDGHLKYQETILDGFENLPNALNMLFHGKNKGKLMVKSTT